MRKMVFLQLTLATRHTRIEHWGSLFVLKMGDEQLIDLVIRYDAIKFIILIQVDIVMSHYEMHHE